ncbi:hypothetical protein AB0395_10755 [Streptosporangium sp. NPDC051023]|uniref:hypothetical protein n=1 Tax=Streptosporangium sp. NPDC051023 TaxID=3155410 RepID=UPI00344CDB38
MEIRILVEGTRVDIGRVVDVWAATPDGTGSFGSGYLVTPDLVLTAKHVLGAGTRGGDDPPRGPVVVRSLDDPASIPCEVAWCAEGRLDAALLRLTRPVASASAPTRWGRLVTSTPAIPWEAVGFPLAMWGPGGLRDTDHATGTVNPGAGHLARRINAAVHSAAPEAGHWVGMSGAALFCGPLLTGVIIEDPPAYGSRRLVAEPVTALLDDPVFAALTGHPTAEPVELRGLFRAERAETPAVTPGSLLGASRQVIAFHGREALLEELAIWRDDPRPVSVKLITGEGGQGKTRLAHRFLHLTPASWVGGFLDSPQHLPGEDAGYAVGERALTPEILARLAEGTCPVLIVADYAESGPQRVALLLESLLSTPPRRPVRVLLLARAAGAWWDTLRHRLAREHPRCVAETVELAPLAGTADLRGQEFAGAVNRFAELLPGFPELPAADWPGLALRLCRTPPDLADERYGNALTVHMAALNALLRAAVGGDPSTVTDPEAELAGHERDYLLRVAHRRRLLQPGVLSARLDPDEQHAEAEKALWRALAAAILLGPCDPDRALAVGRLAGDAHARDVAAWLAALYPPAEHDRAAGVQVAAIQPDRLAERLAGQILVEQDTLLPSIASLATDVFDARTLLIVMARAAVRPAFTPSLDGQIRRLVATCAEPYATAAQLAAPVVERPDPLVGGLLELGEQSPDHLTEQFDRVSGSLPRSSLSLAGLTLGVIELQERVYRGLADADPDRWLPELAVSLNNLVFCLVRVERWADALPIIEQAVRLHRELIGVDRDSHLPGLAGSAANHAACLMEVGRPAEAVAASEEAVGLKRELASRAPRAHLSGLADLLNNHATYLAEVRRPADAVVASEESVFVYRMLAEADRDTHLPGLARSLNTHARCQAAAGRAAEAAVTSEEAAVLWRGLAAHSPDPYLLDLAKTLNNHALQLERAGRLAEAVVTGGEAVGLWRGLATLNRDGYLLVFAGSLGNQLNRLAAAGRLAEAVVAGEELAGLRRELTALDRETHLPLLADLLNTHTVRLAELGRRAEAVAASGEAVGLWRELAALDREAFLPGLAVAVGNHGKCLGEAERWADAVSVGEEAVALHRALFALDPETGLQGYAQSLSVYGFTLAGTARWGEAVAPWVETLVLGEKLREHGQEITGAAANGLRIAYLNAPGEVGAAYEAATGRKPPGWIRQTPGSAFR